MSLTENTQTFTASRWTKGNRIFPTKISVSPVQVIKTKRSWFSSDEESINIRHISSVRIKTGVSGLISGSNLQAGPTKSTATATQNGMHNASSRSLKITSAPSRKAPSAILQALANAPTVLKRSRPTPKSAASAIENSEIPLIERGWQPKAALGGCLPFAGGSSEGVRGETTPDGLRHLPSLIRGIQNICVCHKS